MILKQAVFLSEGLWAAGGNHAVPFSSCILQKSKS